MFSIYIALVIFFFSFIIQIFIVRVFRYVHIHTFFSFLVYLIGLIVVIVFSFSGELPYTSILIYILLTLLLMTISPIPLLGVRSPSFLIIMILDKKKKLTQTQLNQRFNEKEMILARLEDLVDVGLVRRRADTYIILQKGLLISHLITACSAFMGLRKLD